MHEAVSDFSAVLENETRLQRTMLLVHISVFFKRRFHFVATSDRALPPFSTHLQFNALT